MYKVSSSLSVQESPTHNVCHSFKICSVAYPPSWELGGHVCLCNCISQTSFFPALLTIVVVTSRGVGSDVCIEWARRNDAVCIFESTKIPEIGGRGRRVNWYIYKPVDMPHK